MPYVPGCRHDIFVSYASENDRDGWVGQFVKKLGEELEEQLSRRRFSADRSIYFDQRALRAGDDFPKELEDAARHSAFLIPVLSPGYAVSPWCEQERIAFETRLPDGATLPHCLAPLQIRPVHDPLPAEISPDHTHIYSFMEDNRPCPTGSVEWGTRLNRFADHVAQKLQALRRLYKAVYVGRSPKPFVALRGRVCDHLETHSFRTTDNPAERLAVALHFAGGTDGEKADLQRLEAIERTAQLVPSFVFQPFGADLSPGEELWRESVQAATKWIRQKHEQELLDILEDELTRLTLPPPAAADVVLACDPVDEPKARWLEREIGGRRFEVKLAEFHVALMNAAGVRDWTTLVRRARALVYCWGGADQQFLSRLEKFVTGQKQGTENTWYLLEPDVDRKRTERPNAFSNPADLVQFLTRITPAGGPPST